MPGAVTEETVRVCVIGAGPSGLALAHALLHDEGITDFVVLEKGATVGGVWAPGGHAWDDMKTNLSKIKCSFSSLQHPETTPLFPTRANMMEYFAEFARRFDLEPRIRVSHDVESARRSTDPNCEFPWTVRARNTQTDVPVVLRSQVLCVCSGVFSTPHIPTQFRTGSAWRDALPPAVNVVHSGQLKWRQWSGGAEPTQQQADAKKTVVVVGCAYSGADLATSMARCPSVAKVYAVLRTPRLFLPRYFGIAAESTDANAETVWPESTGKHAAVMPWDLHVEVRRAARDDTPAGYPVPRTTIAQKHAWAKSVSTSDSAILRVDPDADPANLVICDEFLPFVEAQRVEIVRAVPTPDDVASLGVTDVVLATGYDAGLAYLDSNVLSLCDFDPADGFLPVVAYKATVHPTYNDVFFVGMYRGPYLATLEVQGRWVAALISGRCSFPTASVLAEGVRLERLIRTTRGAHFCGEDPRAHAFPHGDFVQFTDSIAEEFGAKPLAAEMPDLLEGSPVIPQHYRLCGPCSSPTSAAEAARVIAQWNQSIRPQQ